ncbi:MAG TPA: hypothetical protein VMW86_08985 [Dehalococcoidales bacterium]|nr:hypothetical protein [Dehalococcoidales bacterium]
MAEFWYNTGKLRCWAGATGEIDIINDAAVKIMALETDDEDTDSEFIGDVLVSGAEVTSTGYTGGFGGADRLALASKVLAVDQANNRAEFDCADITWTAISRAAAETWVAFLVMKEITNDAASPVIAHLEPTGVPLTPNGSDIKITIDAEGLLHIT